MKSFDTKTALIVAIFIAYLALLLKLIVFKHPPGMVLSGANFVPFETIQIYLNGKPTWTVAILNLVGNTALFIPLGFLTPFLHQRIGWWLVLTGSIAFSLTLERLQLALKVGSFDVDDILLNTLGAMFGFAVLVSIKKIYSHA